jgi:hypothetical protein
MDYIDMRGGLLGYFKDIRISLCNLLMFIFLCCVCMYVCMYVCMHIQYVCVTFNVRMYICINVCMHACIG